LINKAPSKIGKSSLRILEMVYHNRYVTIPEMAKSIDITERAIEKNIQKLKEQELIVRKEGERAGYWELIMDKD
ncbi:MAG: HTH domain-containing protein, partial [Cyclobacteriaceae bacterium]